MRRTKEARRHYAAKRMSLAVDRIIRGDKSPRAAAWVAAWSMAAGIRRTATSNNNERESPESKAQQR